MIKMVNYYRMVGMILLIMAVFVCPSVAYPATWTTAGSAGTVDDADTAIAVFSGPTVTVSNAVTTATLDIRYNVVEVGGLDSSGRFELDVRHRDNGASAQVIVSLKRHNVSSGTTTTLMTFDSNTVPQSTNFQTAGISSCEYGLDFSNYVYYIEVALKKFSSTGNPGLSGIWLRRVGDVCP